MDPADSTPPRESRSTPHRDGASSTFDAPPLRTLPYGGSNAAVSRSRMQRSHSFTGANTHTPLLHRLEHPLLPPSAANPPLASVLCTVSLFPVASMKGRQSLFAWLLLVSSLTCLLLFSGISHLHFRVRRSSASTSPRTLPRAPPVLTRETACAFSSAPSSAPRDTLPSAEAERLLLRGQRGSETVGSVQWRGSSAAEDAVRGVADTNRGKTGGAAGEAQTCSKCRSLEAVLQAAVRTWRSEGETAATAVTAREAMRREDAASEGTPDDEDDVESASPERLLARAARRSVIVVSFSEAWAPMMQFFLERLRVVERDEARGREDAQEREERRMREKTAGEEDRRRVEAEGRGREAELGGEKVAGRGGGDGGEEGSGVLEGAGSSAELGGLLARLVVVAYDDGSFEACCRMGLNCYMDWQEDAEEKDDFSGEQKHFMTRAYIHLVWRKVHVVHSMLQLGYDVLFTDTDILWLQNPLLHLWQHPHDLQMSADWWSPHPRSVVANGGFYAARSNGRTLRFFNEWLAWHRRTPQFRIQQVFNWIRPEANPFTRVASPLLLRYLPTNQFGGFCEMGHSLSHLFTVHANCCPGLGNKLPVLRQLAGDWDFFSALPLAARESMEERGFEWKGRNCSANWNKLPRDTPIEGM